MFWTIPQAERFWKLRFWKFGLVGGFVALIGIALLYVLVDILSIEKSVAYFVLAIISLQLNFNLNDWFTWGERRKGNNNGYWNRWIKFHATRALSAVIDQILFALLASVLGVHYILASVMCIIIATGWNYLMGDRFVFARRAR